MHPHLHSAENYKNCEDVINALEECHARGFIWKTLGMCTTAKHQVNMCLRANRLERTKVNREAAKEKRAQYEAKWKEIDANS